MQIRPYVLHSSENSVKMVAVPKDNLPIFTKNKNHVRQFHIP